MSRIKNSATFAVFKFEFVRQIKKPSFWASIILFPLLIFGFSLIAFLVGKDSATNVEKYDENSTIAVVDEARLLPEEAPFVIDGGRERGVEMVKNQEVDLFFYIPADFSESRNIEFYHISETIDIFNAESNAIRAILSQYLTANLDPAVVVAITGNFNVADNPLTSSGEPSNALGQAIIPLVFLVLYFIFLILFGSRLLMTVVEEKENRISEMILTSVSAKHLIVGKIFSMLLLGVIQILAFVLPIIILLFVFRDNAVISRIISLIVVNPTNLILTILLFIFSTFFLIGASTFVGAVVPTAKDASQFIGPIVIGTVFPLYFMQLFLMPEPGAFVEFLTYFPLSAPMALMLRNAFGTLSMPGFLIGLVEIAVMSVVIIRVTIKTFVKNAINFSLVLPKFARKRR
ncbi:ABC transporter permease [Candidatus Saccharibacteria bacterium]|nr:ABC transporter permease [Candidatus Saccharibacteria bacterium]